MKSKFLPLTAACAAALLLMPRAFANDADSKFKMMDTDGDGRVSRAEHAAGAKQMFDKMDANHDGYVTAEEMQAYHDQKADMRGPDMNKSIEMTASEKIKMIDQDGDGRISADEHAAGSEKMFNQMDTDGDGYLSKAEMAAGHEMMKKK
ncbi:MAG: Calcium-binding EF-hand-containing protein [Verrucomicrobia bacterium]|nr:Calcium-binding EF-hand-containing protein [Verrucomicrobiota bacterium]